MLEELNFCTAMQNGPFLAERCVLTLNLQKNANPALTHPIVATDRQGIISNIFLSEKCGYLGRYPKAA